MNQISKFYITSFLKNQTYFTPIFIILLQFNHLNFQEIFWVFAIGSAVSFIAEIPTGIIADLYGKKQSIIISKLGIFISFIIFGFAHSFWVFVIAQAIYELANSFRTGTETAYTFDYILQNESKEKMPNYTEVKGKQKFWARLGESLATATGGFIAVSFGYSSVFFLAAIPALINFFLALTWEKIYEKKKKTKSLKFAKKSLKTLFSNKDLLRVTINIMLFTSILAALQKFIQPYMLNAGIQVKWFGIIYSTFLIIAAFLVRYSFIIEKKYGTITTMNTITLISAIPIIILSFQFISIIGVFLFFLVITAENVRSPIGNNLFHKNVESHERSTLGSMLSLAKSLGKAILLPIIGWISTSTNMYSAIFILGILVLINSIFFSIHLNKSNAKVCS